MAPEVLNFFLGFGFVWYGLYTYYHAKSQAPSLKNEWVMVNLVLFGLVLYGIVYIYYQQNFELLAWKWQSYESWYETGHYLISCIIMSYILIYLQLKI